MRWTWGLLLLFVGQTVAYTIPAVRFEYPTMRGFRASIPDTPGIQMFAFHARLNKPFDQFEEGDYTEDVTAPDGDGRWMFDTNKPALPNGTIIYYWVYVQFANEGYWLTDKKHTVIRTKATVAPKSTTSTTTTVKPTTTTPAPCPPTLTTFNGGQPTCAGKLLFEDTFEQGSSFAPKWQHEVRIPLDTESAEFVSYQSSPENSYIAAGRLVIVPTLVTQTADYTDERIRTGELTLAGCTSPTNNPYECQRKAARSTILPPVVSAKLNTKHFFRFRYGRVEIRAKLPKGDWIFPQLYLQPYENYYGYADYASGQMWIAHILANRMLAAADGRQIDGHRLRGGVLITNTGPVRSDFLRSNLNEEHFGDQFHVYGLVWTPEQILLTVDGFQYGALRTNFRQHAQQHNLTQANLWSADAPLAPFDREFYVSLGVGVGGVKDFPDHSLTGPSRTAKPWNNTSPKAEYLFYQNRNTWYRTWTEPELTVDYYSESSCLQRLVNYRECCSMPRLLPEQVIETCRARPLPTAIPGVPDPLPENCIAECALNETGILFNGQFRVEQAVKALSTQVPNDTLTWQHVIEVASKKCYMITVADTFYLRDVAKNLISPQCIPSSFRFLQCTFSIVYRDCPDIYWNYQNDRCGQFVVALNNCYYLFRHIWDI